MSSRAGRADPGSVVRRVLLATLLIGLVGTLVELLLLEHTEGFLQQVPLYLLIAGLLALGWHGVRPGAASIRVLQGTMLLFLLSGAAGVLLHYDGNVEFELEMHATATGFELFREAIKGATPALAPGTMILLGLVGLTYTLRHPALLASNHNSSIAHGEST